MFFSSNLHQDICRNHFPKSWPSSSPSPLATQCDASWVSCPRIAWAKRRCAPPAETTFHPKASSFWLAEQLEQNDDTSTTSHLIPAFQEISRWFTGKSVEKWRHFNLMEILIDLTIYWIFIKFFKALVLKMFFCLCMPCVETVETSLSWLAPAGVLSDLRSVHTLRWHFESPRCHQPAPLRQMLSWFIGEFCLEAQLVSSVSKCLGQLIFSFLGLRSPSSCLEMRAKL